MPGQPAASALRCGETLGSQRDEGGEALDALGDRVVAEGEREADVAGRAERLARARTATLASASTCSASSSVVVHVRPASRRPSSPLTFGKQ